MKNDRVLTREAEGWYGSTDTHLGGARIYICADLPGSAPCPPAWLSSPNEAHAPRQMKTCKELLFGRNVKIDHEDNTFKMGQCFVWNVVGAKGLAPNVLVYDLFEVTAGMVNSWGPPVDKVDYSGPALMNNGLDEFRVKGSSLKSLGSPPPPFTSLYCLS